MTNTNKADVTVYYDGSCPLCTAEIAHYRRLAEDRVAFVDVSSNSSPEQDHSQKQAKARFHVRDPSGQLQSGAHAFITLWQHLPGWRRLAPLARLPGATPLLEIAYRAFLPLRPLLSRIAGWLGAKAEH